MRESECAVLQSEGCSLTRKCVSKNETLRARAGLPLPLTSPLDRVVGGRRRWVGGRRFCVARTPARTPTPTTHPLRHARREPGPVHGRPPADLALRMLHRPPGDQGPEGGRPAPRRQRSPRVVGRVRSRVGVEPHQLRRQGFRGAAQGAVVDDGGGGGDEGGDVGGAQVDGGAPMRKKEGDGVKWKERERARAARGFRVSPLSPSLLATHPAARAAYTFSLT